MTYKNTKANYNKCYEQYYPPICQNCRSINYTND